MFEILIFFRVRASWNQHIELTQLVLGLAQLVRTLKNIKISNTSTSTDVIRCNSVPIFKIFEAIGSTSTVYETMKFWKISGIETMIEYVDQVKDVYVSKRSVYVSKGMFPYHHPIYKSLRILYCSHHGNDCIV